MTIYSNVKEPNKLSGKIKNFNIPTLRFHQTVQPYD